MKIKLVILLISIVPIFSLTAQKAVRKNIKQGNRSYNEQKYEQAATKFEEAIKINPNTPEANYNLANTLYRQKEWDKSIEQLQHYLLIEKDNEQQVAASWHNIGNALLQKKELQKSMEAYKNALRINPEDDEARYNLAVVQKMINDEEEQEQEQEQNQEQKEDNQPDSPEQQQNQKKKPEEPTEPEQMSRDNARQILQAIEQDEKETQKRLNEMKAEERKQKAQENRRQNKDW